MTFERQIENLHAEVPANQISTKRGFPVYRTNPSVPATNGIPTRTKRIIAIYVNSVSGGGIGGGLQWSAGGGSGYTAVSGAIPGSSASPSATTCYDNGGGTGPMLYSLGQNHGAGLNCALSFQMQGGD